MTTLKILLTVIFWPVAALAIAIIYFGVIEPMIEPDDDGQKQKRAAPKDRPK